MRLYRFVGCALLVFVLPCVAADDWGDAVNGLRMGIAIESGTHPEIRIAVRNVDDTQVLLTFGSLIGSRSYDLRFRVILTEPGGKDRHAIFAGGPGAVGGRIDQLVVPLISGATYTVQIPLASFSVVHESANLETFILKRCKVRVELEIRNPTCPLYGYPNPNMIPCWQGKVVSNTLQLPYKL